MGLFDHVRFSYLMPDGKIGPDYVTKHLLFAMDMSYYEVNQDGRLIRIESDQQSLGDLNFDHAMVIDDVHADRRTFDLRFRDGVLREIYCFQTERTVPFEPEKFRVFGKGG